MHNTKSRRTVANLNFLYINKKKIKGDLDCHIDFPTIKKQQTCKAVSKSDLKSVHKQNTESGNKNKPLLVHSVSQSVWCLKWSSNFFYILSLKQIHKKGKRNACRDYLSFLPENNGNQNLKNTKIQPNKNIPIEQYCTNGKRNKKRGGFNNCMKKVVESSE